MLLKHSVWQNGLLLARRTFVNAVTGAHVSNVIFGLNYYAVYKRDWVAVEGGRAYCKGATHEYEAMPLQDALTLYLSSSKSRIQNGID